MTKTKSLFPEDEELQTIFNVNEEPAVDALNDLLDSSDEILIKKMALNDWEWSIKKNKHQNGPLIPKGQRESGFFPELQLIPRAPGEKPIYLANFDIVWPQIGEILSASFRYFTSKRESHLTGVPKVLFMGIAPASFIVIGKSKDKMNGGYQYQAVVIDSASDEADKLVDLFNLQPSFLCDLFTPAAAVRSFEDKLFDFIEQALAAFKAGKMPAFARAYATLPDPHKLAKLAQKAFLSANPDTTCFDPFTLSAPGDCLMTISRGIELEIFREFELRQRSLELVSLILGDGAKGLSIDNVFRSIVRNFPRIDKILLSASQTRKARAGRSFEYHIETLLKAGSVPHKVQVIMTSKRRPDFVLPNLALYNHPDRPRDHALVLSAKTTLRERWKQVEGEINNCDLYLATVDDKIAENAISAMKDAGITLVVPESLKNSTVTVYKGQDNVISFKDFFNNDLKKSRYPIWATMGLL